MSEITTSIEIDAPAETVWAVLTDFDRYDEWNPYTRIEGDPIEGTILRVAPGPDAGRMPTFRPRVLSVIPNQELRWLGHLYVRGLFDGEHRFRIESIDEDRSRLIQDETFSGSSWGRSTGGTARGPNETSTGSTGRSRSGRSRWSASKVLA